MWKAFTELLDQYHGLIIGFAVLGAVVLLNQVIYRHRWKSFPTLDEYLAAHPHCGSTAGVLCNGCGRRGAGMGVIGSGRLYTCTHCETGLYRADGPE